MTGLRWAGVVVAIGLAAAAIAAYTAFGAFLPWREEAEAERLAQMAGVRVHWRPLPCRQQPRQRRHHLHRGRLAVPFSPNKSKICPPRPARSRNPPPAAPRIAC